MENPYAAALDDDKKEVGAIKEAEKEPEVGPIRAAGRAMPLRTRIILIVVGIAGLGLLVNAIDVSSLMREVSYNRMDQELET